MKNHENVPAIIQPKTTRTTAVTTIMEGFFFSIQQAKSKLDKGRSLLKTLYLKIGALSILSRYLAMILPADISVFPLLQRN